MAKLVHQVTSPILLHGSCLIFPFFLDRNWNPFDTIQLQFPAFCLSSGMLSCFHQLTHWLIGRIILRDWSRSIKDFEWVCNGQCMNTNPQCSQAKTGDGDHLITTGYLSIRVGKKLNFQWFPTPPRDQSIVVWTVVDRSDTVYLAFSCSHPSRFSTSYVPLKDDLWSTNGTWDLHSRGFPWWAENNDFVIRNPDV